MRDEEHHAQDAAELYAVYLLQRLAEDQGRAITYDSGAKHLAYVKHVVDHGYPPDGADSSRWSVYKRSCDRHLPSFFARLARKYPRDSFDFTNVEVENRNAQRKGDFLITKSDGMSLSVSLKNYRNGALRPQLNSGTFNSFILNFLFDSDGVGWFNDPNRWTVPNTPAAKRDQVLQRNGYSDIVVIMHEIDQLNLDIRTRFIDTPEFEYLDEETFDRARKECGAAGATLALKILARMDESRLKARALSMIGMDGSEEMLIMDPERCSDSITIAAFQALRESLRDPATHLRCERRHQGIGFDFVGEGKTLLRFYVPFTINKNGAWISGDRYEGVRFHKKEGRYLSYGQRRPKKSRELATSINTYVDFSTSGIFGTPQEDSILSRDSVE